MSSLILPVAIGAILGAALGYYGQCSSGTCVLTSTWWRGAIYGAALGGLFSFGSGRSAGLGGGRADSTNLLHLSESDFDARVLQAEKPVLVDFYAPWCGPCKALAPTIARLADEYNGRVQVAKVNVDNAPQLSDRYRVEGIPTLIFFQGGKMVDSVVGLVSEKVLRLKLEKLAAAPPASLPSASGRDTNNAPGSEPVRR